LSRIWQTWYFFAVFGRLKDLVEDFRGGEIEAGRRDRAYENLVGEVRSTLVYIFGRLGCPDGLADDLAQDKAQHLADYLVATQHANLDTLVWRTAKNRVIDEQRRRQRELRSRHLSIDNAEERENGFYSPGQAALDEYILTEWEEKEREREDDERVEQAKKSLWSLVDELKDGEKRLLQAVFVEERPIEELAEDELARSPTVMRGPNRGEPRTIEQARNYVDQQITRVRKKLLALQRDGQKGRTS